MKTSISVEEALALPDMEVVPSVLPEEVKIKGGTEFTKEEEAAAKIKLLLPFLKKTVGNMSAKSAARVLTELAIFPIGDSTDLAKTLRSKDERQAFKLFFELQAAKQVVLEYVKKSFDANGGQAVTSTEIPVEKGETNVTE